jgi:GNAT superfamily N-acetyltransferase
MEFRRASEGDLPAEFAVFVAAQVELHERRAAAWPVPEYDPAGPWAEVHRHLLNHDGERSFLAEHDGRVIGFTAALVRGDCWFFAALFVDPEFQGQGVGRELLDRAWNGTHRRRITITEAIQPASTGLYAARGLLPMTPILRLAGEPAIGGVDGLEATPPTADALRALDLAAYGFDRAADHAFWGRTCADATLWRRDGRPLAYSYRNPWGIGPVAGVDPASAALALRAELARRPGSSVDLGIPGTATALVEVALAAGLRFSGDPGLLLLSPIGNPPPTALAIHTYWLY